LGGRLGIHPRDSPERGSRRAGSTAVRALAGERSAPRLATERPKHTMKRLVQRKGFRVAVRMLVGGMSLLALAWAAYNWSGARAKSAALASARAAGLPLTLEEFVRDMPPE